MKNAENIDLIESSLAVQNSLEANSANDVINEWLFKSETVIQDISLILNRNSNLIVRKKAAFLLLHQIDAKWAKYDQESHEELRNSFVELLFNSADSDEIRDILAECVAKIATFSVLDEIPEFFTSICFFDENCTIDIQRQKLNLIYKFYEEVEIYQL